MLALSSFILLKKPEVTSSTPDLKGIEKLWNREIPLPEAVTLMITKMSVMTLFMLSLLYRQ
jgi:hypothetical protein